MGSGTPVQLIKENLTPLSPGFHVAIFSTMTAADAGAVPVDTEIVAVGGTEYGLDPALVVKHSYSDMSYFWFS